MEAGWLGRGLEGCDSPEGTGGKTMSVMMSRDPLAPNFPLALDTQTLILQGPPEGQRLWVGQRPPELVGDWPSEQEGGSSG